MSILLKYLLRQFILLKMSKNKLKVSKKEFEDMIRNLTEKEKELLSIGQKNFIEFYMCSPANIQNKLFNTCTDIINSLVQYYDSLKQRGQEAKEDKEYLVRILEEYLKIFKDKKEHQKIHKKEPCLICTRAKKLLRKLKNGR